ncbi:hypothetical protein ACRAWB_05575 [Leifsonia poae]|uniref:hypothetical protein n=1 Tax=Leifsonia poae TaxID=110933 RepID=UPI003D68B3FA
MRLPRLRLIAAASAVAAGLALVPAPALAESPAPFYPGYIISDDSFYNPDAMTPGQIQDFLEERSCHPKDGVPCLADFRMNSPAQPASAERCAAMPARKKEAASSIIARVAKACTVSPRVLLVLLQKEQSLLTAPSASGYQKATGYACPDTAACDTRYFGFFNQVYRAAWQFREYTVHPGDWRYKVGDNRIQYHPDPACGAGEVRILNQATARPVQLHAVPAERRDAEGEEGSGRRVLGVRQPQLLAALLLVVRVAAGGAVHRLRRELPHLHRRVRLPDGHPAQAVNGSHTAHGIRARIIS